MSNNKLNKLVLTKRPAKFLPDEHQVRRDFGGVSKKPKLDIRLSQSTVANVSNSVLPNDHFGGIQRRSKLDVRLSQTSTSHLSSTNAPVPSTNDVTLDDLWGEDLSAEAVEECLFLASQVCPEVISAAHASTSIRRVPDHTSHGQNSYDGGLSKSSFDNQFKVPLSSRQSNLKSKPSTSAFLSSACKEIPRTSVPVNQSIISFNQKNASSNLHPFSSNSSVVVNRNHQTLNGLQVSCNDSDALSEEIKKLQLENKKLKDASLSREGEISIIRQQMKQLQMQLETQRVEHISKLEEYAQKYKEQLNEHKKELEITNTQLQFKIMEATTMRNHCKLLESTTKLKLVEPQRSTSSDPGKVKGDCFSQNILPSDISPPKIHSVCSSKLKGQPSPAKKPIQKVTELPDTYPANQRSCSVPQNCPTNSSRYREGSIFGVAVNEFLFKKSAPEVSWILCIRKKQSLCRRIKEADDINSAILSLQQNDKTLESCYTAVNRLIAMDSLDSPVTTPYVEKVVEVCQEIVCRQVHILRLLLQVQSKTERVLLSEEIASVIGTLAVKEDRNLMSAKQWYCDEEGVESRRALGLLSVLCDLSHLAADLITGTIQPCSKGDITEMVDSTKSTVSSSPPPCRRQLAEVSSKGSHPCDKEEACPSVVYMEQPKDADTSNMEIEFISPDCSDSQISTKLFDSVGFEEGYCEYARKSFGFLQLLKDLAFSINIQRRTRHFIGVLTGIMTLLKAVVSLSSLTDDGLKIISQIIQEVVFACPQVEVIVAMFELLRALSPYTVVMNALCHNCESSALVDKRYINLTYFSRGSCMLQVLFRLLPKGEMSMSLRTNLCSHMVRWLYNMVCIPRKEISWMLAFHDDASRTCQCKHKLTQGLVITLYNSVCDFEQALAKGNKLEWELRHILVMGIMVLRNLLQREFGLYFESAEEEYQLLISKIQMVSNKLELNSMQRGCLTDLLNVEEKSDDEKTEIQESFDAYWNESASQCRTLLSSRAPSHQQPPKKPRRSIAQINKAWNIAT